MVMSLSCDKAVWNAVMNNEAVQDFRRSLHDGKENDRKGGTSGPSEVLKWILDSAQAKILEFLENVMKIFNMLIHPQEDEEKPDAYSDAVKVSFMLTVFVFIVVAIARIK
jgi:aromatic ring-cleaving dioxygenase